MPGDSTKDTKTAQNVAAAQNQENGRVLADDLLASFDPFGLPTDNRSHADIAWNSKAHTAPPNTSQSGDGFMRPSELFKKLEVERTIPARKIVR